MIRLKFSLALMVQFLLLQLLSAQNDMGWKKFLYRENANFHSIYAEVEQYFETHEKTEHEEAIESRDDEEEGSEYNQFQRWKWFWGSRVNADGSFPDIRPLAQLRSDRGVRYGVTDRSGDPEQCGWHVISQNTCLGGYNGMGRTTSVAFHPTNLNIFYVGSPNGGVWKTTDGGDSYVPISEGLPYNGAANLMIDYENPEVLYVSNGDHSGWWTYSTGIYKSTDGGASWTPTPLNWSLSQGVAVLSADMNPQNPKILIVAASNGLHRSTDGGASWTKVRDGFYSDVKFRPGDGTTVYAALHDYWGTSHVYRSTDGGVNWTKIDNFTFSHNWIRLAVTKANPDLLSALCEYDDKKQFYFSDDSGATLNFRSDVAESAMLTMSATDPNTIYCGYQHIFRSTDQGNTWTQITEWFNSPGYAEIHADQHYAAAQPGTSNMFFCNDGGLYRLNEATKTWTDRSNGLIITQFYRIAVAQTNDVFMIGGTQDNGGRKRVAPGEWASTNGGDGMEVAVDYTNADIMYTTYVTGQLYRSMDGWNGDVVRISNNLPGQTPDHDLNGAWVSPYQIDPQNPAALVLAYAEVYRTTNRGNTWAKISDGMTGNTNLDALCIAPSNSNIILTSTGNKLYKTSNMGANWSTYTVPGSAAITSITIHPTDPNIVYITRGGYNAGVKVYRSVNGGGTWANISGSLPNVSTNTLYLDVAADGSYTLFVGNDLGVWYRRSTQTDWVPMNQNLPITIVSDLELQKSSRSLRAGTYGRGIWEYDLGHLPGRNFAVCATENRAKICLPQHYTANISANAWADTGGPIELTLGQLPAGATADLSSAVLSPDGMVTLDVDLPAGMAEGEYPITVYAAAGGDTSLVTIRLTVVSNDFSALALQQPAFGASGVSRFPLLRWTAVADANSYELELATSPSFDSASIVKSYANLKLDSLQWTAGLEEGHIYYWHIRPVNECGAGAWTEPFVFATASKTCVALVSNDVPKPITANSVVTVESKIVVPTGGAISELKIKNVQGNHTFFKDLTASIVGPSGTEVVLFNQRCGSYSGNFKLGFEDEAPQAFGCPPPQNGNSYRPEGKLSAFTGQDAAGNWILRVKDNSISSGGEISGFAIEFCSEVALNPPYIVNNHLLQVEPGNNAVVATGLLQTADADNTPQELLYTLVAAPKYGHLERAWTGPMKAGQQFTQADLDNGAIRYFDYGIPNNGDSFRFSVTDGNGGLVADVFQVQQFPLGASEPGTALNFALAPNPTSDLLRLMLPEALPADAQVQLLNTSGQLLRQWALPAGAPALQLAIGDLPAGVYLVRVQSRNGMGVKRVSKI